MPHWKECDVPVEQELQLWRDEQGKKVSFDQPLEVESNSKGEPK